MTSQLDSEVADKKQTIQALESNHQFQDVCPLHLSSFALVRHPVPKSEFFVQTQRTDHLASLRHEKD